MGFIKLRKRFKSRSHLVKKESFNLVTPEEYRGMQTKVSELQHKISLALTDDNKKKAKRLATILVRTKAAQILAVRRVISNVGARSPGWSIPRLQPKTNTQYAALLDQLHKAIKRPLNYVSTPLYRIHIPKPNGSLRPISVPSYLDRCMQALYLLALDPFAEQVAAKDSYGFRKGRSPIWAVYRIQKLLNNPFVSIPFIVELDIEGCFDNISHKFVMDNIPVIPRVILYKWLKCGFIVAPQKGHKIYDKLVTPTDKGVPQGGIISPTISNMVLDRLEVPPVGRQAKNYYIRFAYDVIALVNPSSDPKDILKGIESHLDKVGLNISKSKTKITPLHNLNKPTKFNFCGHEFLVLSYFDPKTQKVNQKCLTRPRPENLKRHKAKLYSLLNKQTSLPSFIARANPIITGFCNFYRFSNSSDTFGVLSIWLYHAVNNWLRRRKGWSIERISNHISEHKDNEACPTPGGWFWYLGLWKNRTYDSRVIFLKRHSSYTIIYPRPSPQAGLDFFNIEDREKLISINIQLSPGRKRTVLLKYKGLCGLCSASMLDKEFELHHILPLKYGGKDENKNLIPLCKYPCHLSISKVVAGLPMSLNKCKPFVEQGVLNLPKNFLDLLEK